jgi:hypothetical protein
MPKVSNKIDYSKTPITFYRFVCNDENVTESYVGHTSNFRQRKCVHKNKCNNPLDRLYNTKIYQTIRDNGGWDAWNMVEIKTQMCESIRDATRVEQELINELKSTMNSARAYVSPELRKQETFNYNANYRASHKEHYIKYGAKYRATHKEQIAQYRATHKEQAAHYRATHKEQAAAYRAKMREQKRLSAV